MNALDVAVAVLVPAGTTMVRGECDEADLRRRVGVGEQVVLVDGARLSPHRLRRLACDAGLVVDRELLVLPSLRAPAFVVEDAGASMRWFWSTFATVPPGRTTGSLAITLVTRAARHRPFLSWAGHLIAGRLVVAHRP
ncbi:MAG: hypothetical protein M3Y71_03355 [Actinomycetota bacterium]|nr:hypothetical protein [Actinomycetota bacterium]